MNIQTLVLGPLETNCYILEEPISGKMAIIDPAVADERLFEAIKGKESRIEYILLTHRHVDHIFGVKDLKKLTNAKIAISSLDECGLKSEKDSLFSEIAYLYKSYFQGLKADILLSDGDILMLGETPIKVLATPGHTAGGVCFIIEDNIFSGDTLFFENIGRLDFPTGGYSDMELSLKKLSSLNGDYNVFSGHGCVTTLQHEREKNAYLCI